jgi:hypothetical protein
MTLPTVVCNWERRCLWWSITKVGHKILQVIYFGFYFAGDKIEKNEMGEACSAYGGGERRAQGFGGETLGKETTGETQA